MAKKFVASLLALLSVLSLTACGASVSLYTGSTSSEYVHMLEISVPERLYNELEKTAALKPNSYKRWRLDEWLATFCDLVTFGDGSKYEYEGNTVGGDFVAQMTRRFPISDADDEEEDDEVIQTVKNYFYAYVIEVTQPNPFNGLRTDYDEAAAGQNGSLMQMLKNGIGYYHNVEGAGQVWVEVLPPLAKAFPLVKNYDPGDMTLKLYLGGSSRMASTGTKVKIGRNTYYLWERKFDETDETITLKYYRPNSLGWNITALVVAGLTVVVILLVTRKKKKKETLLDRYPYDPSKPNGDNLPVDNSFRY